MFTLSIPHVFTVYRPVRSPVRVLVIIYVKHYRGLCATYLFMHAVHAPRVSSVSRLSRCAARAQTSWRTEANVVPADPTRPPARARVPPKDGNSVHLNPIPEDTCSSPKTTARNHYTMLGTRTVCKTRVALQFYPSYGHADRCSYFHFKSCAQYRG